jgi:hypothetical protein
MPRSRMISIRVSEMDYQALLAFSSGDERKTLSDLTREAIRRFLVHRHIGPTESSSSELADEMIVLQRRMMKLEIDMRRLAAIIG